MWRREMDCLLSVCDYIVEFFPSKEILSDGTTREVTTESPWADCLKHFDSVQPLGH